MFPLNWRDDLPPLYADKPRSDPVLSKLSRKRNEKTYCTSLEEVLEPETHLDGQTSENELEGGNTRNMRHAKLGHYHTD